MQHLIDLISDRVIAKIGVPPVYINRGDPAAADWLVGDLTKDNNWYDLDLAGVIPSGLSLVHFRCFLLSNLVNQAIQFRTNGMSNDVNIAKFWIPTASQWHQFNFLIPPSPGNKIEYKVQSSQFTGISLTIAGAFK